MTLDPLSLGIGLIIGALVAGALFYGRIAALKSRLEAERDGLDEHFQALARAALKSNTESFLTLAQEKLKQAQDGAKHDLDKRSAAVQEMVKPVQQHLEKLGSAVDQLHGTKKAIHEDLKSLNKETAKLSGALRNPAAQGKWGEFILERLLDKANLIKGVHYESQVSMDSESGRQRPDVVIHLQDGFNIVVDAKAPINEFAQRLEEDLSRDGIADLETRLARQVKNHVKALGAKNYWEQLDSPDFVVLFLPSEHLFSAALRGDAGLIDYASENQVVIASPTLMMSLIRVVGLSWRQVELAKNAQNIADLGSELYDRIGVFSGHMQRVGKGMESALGAYNKAMSSLESRVLVSARKFKDMKAATANKDIPSVEAIEAVPKRLSAQETDLDLDGEKQKASND